MTFLISNGTSRAESFAGYISALFSVLSDFVNEPWNQLAVIASTRLLLTNLVPAT